MQVYNLTWDVTAQTIYFKESPFTMATRGRRHMLYEEKCPAKAIHVAGEVWLRPRAGLLRSPGRREPFQPLDTVHLSIGNFPLGLSVHSEFYEIAQCRGCSSSYEKGGFFSSSSFFPPLLKKVRLVQRRSRCQWGSKPWGCLSLQWLCSTGKVLLEASILQEEEVMERGASLSEGGGLCLVLPPRPKPWVLPCCREPAPRKGAKADGSVGEDSWRIKEGGGGQCVRRPRAARLVP